MCRPRPHVPLIQLSDARPLAEATLIELPARRVFDPFTHGSRSDSFLDRGHRCKSNDTARTPLHPRTSANPRELPRELIRKSTPTLGNTLLISWRSSPFTPFPESTSSFLGIVPRAPVKVIVSRFFRSSSRGFPTICEVCLYAHNRRAAPFFNGSGQT